MEIEAAPTPSLTTQPPEVSPLPLAHSLSNTKSAPVEEPLSPPRSNPLSLLPATLAVALGLQSNVGLAAPELTKGLEWRADSNIAQSLTCEQEYLHLRRKAAAALAEEPFVEDGLIHPLDGVLAAHLNRNPRHGVDNVDRLFNRIQRSQRAALLRSLGRLHSPPEGAKFLALFRRSLGSKELEIRDAAVSSLELLDTPASLSILRDHVDDEADSRLADYIKSVLEESTLP